jgi:SAM-dependent methyltransferase
MSGSSCFASLLLGVTTTLGALSLQAASRERADCIRAFEPRVGQSGKNVIWVPTPDAQVADMLRLARVGPQDVVYDLGAGDGKIAIAAGKLGADAVGIEYDPEMVRLAKCLVEAEQVGERTRIVHGDTFAEDFSRASVVTMYLLPELNLCLRHRLLDMRPGTRVASHQFLMDDWQPDERSDRGSAYLWVVPARVAGTWTLLADGSPVASVRLEQQFQRVDGEVVGSDGEARRISDASLRGDRLSFEFRDDRRPGHRFEGVVQGDEIAGTLRQGNRATPVTARREGAAPAAAWAAMLPRCRDYYEE